MRNLLGQNYATPFVGTPVNVAEAADQASQPDLCTIDQESTYEPAQPATGLYRPVPIGGASYSPDGKLNVMDRAVHLCADAGSAVHPWIPLRGEQLRRRNSHLPGEFEHGQSAHFNQHAIRGIDKSADPFLLQQPFDAGQRIRPRLDRTVSAVARTLGVIRRFFGAWKPVLNRLINPKGQAWHIYRKHCGPIQQIVDPLGHVTSFMYSSGMLTEVIDGGGRSTSFTIDSNHLVQVTSAGVANTSFKYDQNHLLTSVSNPEGDITTFAYDECRRVRSVMTPESEITTYTYIGCTRRVVTDAMNQTWTITLDNDQNVQGVVDPTGITQTYTWEPRTQRLLTFQDGRGNTTTFSYDRMQDHSRRLTQIQRPIGSFNYEFDTSSGNLTSITDENSCRATLQWDSDGYRSNFQDAAGNQYSYGYNGTGQLTSLTDPLTQTYTWTYDGDGRRQSFADPLGNSTTFSYDSNGQLNQLQDAASNSTYYERDSLNRLTKLTDANTHITQYSYDGNGRLTSTRNALQFVTTQVYDQDGRVTEVTDANQHTSTYTYSPLFNRTQVLTAEGFITTSLYDPINRLTTVIDPIGNTTTYAYDNSNNQTLKIDAAIFRGRVFMTRIIG